MASAKTAANVTGRAIVFRNRNFGDFTLHDFMRIPLGESGLKRSAISTTDKPPRSGRLPENAAED
jgi:hypothetical protein